MSSFPQLLLTIRGNLRSRARTTGWTLSIDRSEYSVSLRPGSLVRMRCLEGSRICSVSCKENKECKNMDIIANNTQALRIRSTCKYLYGPNRIGEKSEILTRPLGHVKVMKPTPPPSQPPSFPPVYPSPPDPLEVVISQNYDSPNASRTSFICPPFSKCTLKCTGDYSRANYNVKCPSAWDNCDIYWEPALSRNL